MRRREKLLIVALVVAVLGYLGQDYVREGWWRPWQERQADALARRQRVALLEKDFARLQAEQRALAEAESRSLPDDPSAASTRYHRWLVQLAAAARLDDVVVTPSRHIEDGGTLFRVPMVITGASRMTAVRDFLAALSEARLLQKVTYVRLEAEEPGDDPLLQLTLQLEALAIRGAGAGATAVLQTPPADADAGPRWALITDKNLFRRGYSEPTPMAAVKTPPADPVPPPDMAQHVYLVGLVTKGERREIWLHDRMKKQTTVLAEGEKFELAGVKGQVIAVSTTWALFLVDGKSYRCSLGRNLRQFEPEQGR